MKKISTFLVLVLSTAFAFSQIFDKPQKLFSIQTKYFTIIFPDISKKSALYLAGFADAAYEEVAKKLGTSPEIKIPVLITPSSEDINGYFSYDPILKIVLYETSISGNSELAFNDSLYKLFYHELTHFVSMTGLNPLMRALYSFFGGFVYLAPSFQTPYNFIEGVTVSFESHDGYGRARDPLPGGQIRQDIIENNFKTFVQTMGAWDLYPRGGTIYWYGGYFSLYLQETYGMEAYANLMHYFSNPVNIKLLDDIGVMEGKFRELFGITLEKAWQDFKEFMSIKVPVSMHITTIGTIGYYSGLASYEGSALLYDAYAHTVILNDMKTGKQRTLFRHESFIERMSVHPSSGDILLSTYSGSTQFPKQALEVFSNGKLTKLPLAKLSDAAWAGSRIIAIETDGYTRNLVLLSGSDVITLLRGTESATYWNPVSNEDGSAIYVLTAESGITSLVRLTLKGDTVTVVEKLSMPTELGWLRYLSYANGKVYSAWDDNKLYRLVEIDDALVTYQTVPMSGGVHYPVMVGDALAYLGRFSNGMRLCRFPSDTSQLGFKEAPALWTDASYLIDKESAYEKPADFSIKPYNGARWLLPAGWYPYINNIDGFRIGLNMQFAEPTETITSSLDISWNTEIPQAVDISADANLSLYPFSLQVLYSDNFAAGYRLSAANIGMTLGDTLVVGLRGALQGYSEFTETETDFYRPWDTMSVGGMAFLTLNSRQGVFNEPSKYSDLSAFLLYQAHKFIVPDTIPDYFTGIEANITAAIGKPFVELIVEGGWTPNNTLYYGPMGLVYVIGENAYPATSNLHYYGEFTSLGYSTWYIQSSLALRLVTAEIQRQFLFLYLNRLFIDIGSRAAFAATPLWLYPSGTYDSSNFSVFASLQFTVGTAMFYIAAAHISVGIEGSIAYNGVSAYRFLVTASY